MRQPNLADVRVCRLGATQVADVDVAVDGPIRRMLEELSVAECDGGAWKNR